MGGEGGVLRFATELYAGGRGKDAEVVVAWALRSTWSPAGWCRGGCQQPVQIIPRKVAFHHDGAGKLRGGRGEAQSVVRIDHSVVVGRLIVECLHRDGRAVAQGAAAVEVAVVRVRGHERAGGSAARGDAGDTNAAEMVWPADERTRTHWVKGSPVAVAAQEEQGVVGMVSSWLG